MSTLDSKFIRLLVYIAITLISGLLFSFLSLFVIKYVSGIPIGNISIVLNDLSTIYNVNLTKVLLFFNSFGLFVLPPVIFTFIYKLSFKRFFQFNEWRTVQLLPILILLFVLLLPILNFTIELNKLLVLPDWLSELENWMRNAEDSAAVKTKALLKMENYQDLFFNMLLIAVLPAIGEELAFRGVVQQILIGDQKSPHLGIWGAAFIFSFIHFQFFGFLPRLLLGAFFGYLFFWSKSIWLPILGHFINNGSAVLIAYYLGSNGMEEKLEKIGTTEESSFLPLVAAVLFGTLLYYYKKQTDKILQ